MPSHLFPPKDPDDVLDYAFDWSSVLASGETISAVSVTADAGLTVDSFSESSGVVTSWISGGAPGVTYSVTCEISTNQGRTYERSARIDVKEL